MLDRTAPLSWYVTATIYDMERLRRPTSPRSPADLPEEPDRRRPRQPVPPRLPADLPKKLAQRGGLRPERLLIGLVLIVVGVIWSILNSTIWYAQPHLAPSPPHIPTTVATSPRTIAGLRLLPVLLNPDPTATSFTVTLSFQNAASENRAFNPSKILLTVGKVSVAPRAAGAPLRSITLTPGTFSRATIRFAHALVSGATLVYGATDGHASARWLLWS